MIREYPTAVIFPCFRPVNARLGDIELDLLAHCLHELLAISNYLNERFVRQSNIQLRTTITAQSAPRYYALCAIAACKLKSAGCSPPDISPEDPTVAQRVIQLTFS